VVKAPIILGHETCGIVVDIGAKVTGFNIGDRVALEPGLGCRRCAQCKTGHYNLCPESTFFACPPVDGSLCRYMVHEADFCFLLPDNMTMEEGAMMEPLSVAVYACRRAGVRIGQRVLILGAGPIGLLNMLTATAMGASKVIVTDIDDNRLHIAKENGATKVLNVKGMSPKQVAGQVEALLNGQSADISIDCVGLPMSMEAGIWATRPGGVLAIVGLGGPDRIELPIYTAALKEIDIRGVNRYLNCYPTAIDLVSSGKVNLKKLTRARYTLDEGVEAFKRSVQGDVIKVFVKSMVDG